MEYRYVGNSGLQVSLAGLGASTFGQMDEQESTRLVHAALELGVNHFDSADIYGGNAAMNARTRPLKLTREDDPAVYGGNGSSEIALGRALKGRRHEAVVASKFGNRMGDSPMHLGGSRRWIMEAVEDSLRRLDMDYIDLYYMHYPDLNTPHEETVRAMDDLVTQGKVRYLANSNMAAWQIMDYSWIAQTQGRSPFICTEMQYHLLDRKVEVDVIPATKVRGMGFIPYAPLARGMLTGKYRQGAPIPEGSRLGRAPQARGLLVDENYELINRLQAYAEARGHTIHELALSWLACKPFVSSVIAGVSNIDQMHSNVAATTAWKLTAEEMAEVDAISAR